MKKKPLVLISAALFTLCSCELTTTADEMVTSLSVSMIGYAGSSRVRFIKDEDATTSVLNAFNTSIYGQLYYYDGTYTDEEIEDIRDEFSYQFCRLYALSDYHYNFIVDDEQINNLKTVNDSYGTGESVVLDEFLYDLLKETYEFSMQSAKDDGSLRFDIFAGEINDFYEDKLDHLTSSMTAKNKALSMVNNFIFSDDVVDDVQPLVSDTPKTVSDCDGLLEFNDEEHSVIFNKFGDAEKVSISLSAAAKGKATEYIADYFESIYPDISLLINSGTSSIKAIGSRPDGKSWTIRYMNPLNAECYRVNEDINTYEVKLQVSGAFNLSTSGYYEHYFYVYDEDQDEYIRRDHIINPSTGVSTSFFDQVSIISDNAFLADMYTTTMMTCASVEEAESLKNTLDAYYGLDTNVIYCFKSQDSDPLSQYTYKHSEITDLSDYNLPKMELTDGSTYEGDYSDITVDDISKCVSKSSRSFKETYLASSAIFDNLAIIDDTSVTPNQDKILAVLQEL